MLTELADIARTHAARIAQQTEGLPDDSGPQLADATATGLLQSFQAMAGQAGGLGGLISMLGGGGSSGAGAGAPAGGGAASLSSATGGLEGIVSQVAMQIGAKLGVSESVARQAATAIVPAVLGAIGSRLSGGTRAASANPQGNFSLESLIGSLGSGTNSTDIAGGLGKLLGKLGR